MLIGPEVVWQSADEMESSLGRIEIERVGRCSTPHPWMVSGWSFGCHKASHAQELTWNERHQRLWPCPPDSPLKTASRDLVLGYDDADDPEHVFSS
jgi:hypothetical protein